MYPRCRQYRKPRNTHAMRVMFIKSTCQMSAFQLLHSSRVEIVSFQCSLCSYGCIRCDFWKRVPPRTVSQLPRRTEPSYTRHSYNHFSSEFLSNPTIKFTFNTISKINIFAIPNDPIHIEMRTEHSCIRRATEHCAELKSVLVVRVCVYIQLN